MTIARARIIKAAELRGANATRPSAGVDAQRDGGAASNPTHSVPSSALHGATASAPTRVDGVITQLIGSTQGGAAEPGSEGPTRIARAAAAPDSEGPTRIARAAVAQEPPYGTDTITRIAPGAQPANANAVAHVARTMESAPDVVAQAERERPPLAVLNRADAFGRRMPRVVVDAKAEAARIVAEAEARAGAVAEEAARAAREVEVAKHAAQVLALREADERRAERDLERTIAVATLLAERLIGEALAVNPARIAELAAAALEQTRGATSIRIDANPADVDPLAAALRDLVHITRIEADPTLGRGSLVVHTNLGKVDARLQPQLARLAGALREGAG